MDNKRRKTLAKCRISIYHWQIDNLNDFKFNFGFVRRGVLSVVRAMVNMEYVASNELGNLVRLGIVLEVRFTYVVQSVQYITILLNMFNIPSMTYTTAGPVVCGDGLAGDNLTDSCQQLVRFVGREAFIEPVDLKVFVVVVRAALDTSLREFDVLLW